MKAIESDKMSVASRVSRILSDRASRRRPTNQYAHYSQSSNNPLSARKQRSVSGTTSPMPIQTMSPDLKKQRQPLNARLLLQNQNKHQNEDLPTQQDQKTSVSQTYNYQIKKKNRDVDAQSITSLSLARFNDLITSSGRQKSEDGDPLSIKRNSMAARLLSNHGSSHRGRQQQSNPMQKILTSNKTGSVFSNVCKHRDAHLAPSQAHPCKEQPWRLGLCKKHHLENVTGKILNEVKHLYANPISAFSHMDFHGRGYVTLQDFLTCNAVKRLKMDKIDIMEFIKAQNLFNLNDFNSQVGFEKMSRSLFPQMYQIKPDNEIEMEGHHMKEMKKKLDEQEGDEDLVVKRLRDLEHLLIGRFSNQWETVRKAFLDMDQDYDGFITVEDFMRQFQSVSEKINLMDLKKLLIEKSSSGNGRINYTDFAEWLGQAIHWCEGFYFRHDSIKNPQYEKAIQTYDKRMAANRVPEAIQGQRTQQQLEVLVWEKLQQQWKTIKKAFRDLSNNAGSISRHRLKRQFDNWGVKMTEEQFAPIFEKFDVDGDGIISYKDFLNSAGVECFPKEGLYFRQDVALNKRGKEDPCKNEACFNPQVGLSDYCALHIKIYRDKGLEIFIQCKLGLQKKGRWEQFLKEITAEMKPGNNSDTVLISLNQLWKLLEKFGCELTSKQKYLLQQVYVVSQDPLTKECIINISKLLILQTHQDVNRDYKNATFKADKAVVEVYDTTGYHGTFFRDAKKLEKMNFSSFQNILACEVKFAQVMRTIRSIDRDHNGYITTQEMEDIIKMYYTDLADMFIEPHIHKYTSPLNRVLVDYKLLMRETMVAIEKKKAENDKFSPYEDVASPRPLSKNMSQVMSAVQKSMDQGSLKRNQTNGLLIDTESTMGDHDRFIKSPKSLGGSRSVAAIGVRKSHAKQKSQVLHGGADIARLVDDAAEYQNFTLENDLLSTAHKNEADDSKRKVFLSNDNNRLFAQSDLKMHEQAKTAANFGRSNSCVTVGNKIQKKLILIKQKLSPDWKNIFRQILNVYDTGNDGNIKAKQFEECLHQIGAKFMCRDDLNVLYKKFGSGIDGYEIPNEHIDLYRVRLDYLEMCASLGLDNNKIRVMVNQKIGYGVQTERRQTLGRMLQSRMPKGSSTLDPKNSVTSPTINVMRALERADADVKAGVDVQYRHTKKQLKSSEQISNLTKLYQAGLAKRQGSRNETAIGNRTFQHLKKPTFAHETVSEYTPSEMMKRINSGVQGTKRTRDDKSGDRTSNQELNRATLALIKRSLPEMKRILKKYDSTGMGSVRLSQLMKVLHGQGVRNVTQQHLEQYAVDDKEGNDFKVDYIKFMWNYM